ncbi:hypothetical protein [Halobacillus trueperi]|uniref:hypothetical protein n=1 Tax=Halobacillus trueperi TaxID=156205 RepID=UPI003735E0B7
MNKTIDSIEKKLKHLEDDLLEAKALLHQTKQTILKEGSLQVFSYFNYSLRLPENSVNSPLDILGSFIIKNPGKRTLNHPYICLKLNQNKSISFSGKISPQDLIDHDFSPIHMQTWYYIDQESEVLAHKKGEYWLEPISVKELPSDHSLSFANFMIRLDRTKMEGPFKVEGAVFGEELKEGQRALNKIQVNVIK